MTSMTPADAKRIEEAREAARKLSRLAKVATTTEEWAEVATLAGIVQRRSRLLAGLGRGG